MNTSKYLVIENKCYMCASRFIDEYIILNKPAAFILNKASRTFTFIVLFLNIHFLSKAVVPMLRYRDIFAIVRTRFQRTRKIRVEPGSRYILYMQRVFH